MSWAGQHLRAVLVDTYGSYRFVLVRVNDRTSAHRLLVRGKNGVGVEELMRDLAAEVIGSHFRLHTLSRCDTHLIS